MESPAPNTKPQKILIVEDNNEDCCLLQLALERCGYAITIAAGPHHALLYADWIIPDLILLDIALDTAVDGWEVLRRLRSSPKTASIPVIILSGASEATYLAQAVGSHGYLQKPYSIEELLRQIEEVLASTSADARSGMDRCQGQPIHDQPIHDVSVHEPTSYYPPAHQPQAHQTPARQRWDGRERRRGMERRMVGHDYNRHATTLQ